MLNMMSWKPSETFRDLSPWTWLSNWRHNFNLLSVWAFICACYTQNLYYVKKMRNLIKLKHDIHFVLSTYIDYWLLHKLQCCDHITIINIATTANLHAATTLRLFLSECAGDIKLTIDIHVISMSSQSCCFEFSCVCLICQFTGCIECDTPYLENIYSRQ